jgi:hypothetical protein
MGTKDRTFKPPSDKSQREVLAERSAPSAAFLQIRDQYNRLDQAVKDNTSDTAVMALAQCVDAAIGQEFCEIVGGILRWKAARQVSISRDAVAGAVDARIELAQAAAPRDPPRRGRKVEYGKVREAVSLAEREGHELGRADDGDRVGTADKGKLADRVHKALNVSQTRAGDMLRQAADLAGELPENRIGRKNPSV